jgi:UTP--glucose-1-phosphate uridylyltransferase
MVKKIRTAVFPVAGLGTRLLPATKIMPKEMLPIVDTPLIQMAIEEAKAAGIESFVFVINQGKELLIEHFDEAPALRDVLLKRGKTRELQKLNLATLPEGQPLMTYQKQALGLGHAIWCARDLIADDAFAVILPDDVIRAQTPCLEQMVKFYEMNQGNIMAAMRVAPEQISKYGAIDPADVHTDYCSIQALVEKPEQDKAPSNFAVIGRYILHKDILNHLDDMVIKNQTGAGGEIQLTDAIAAMIPNHKTYGYFFEGERHDCGSELGFIKAQIAFGLDRPHLRADLLAYLKSQLA